ncbi:MAG: hypothetical protein Q9227_006656 [Pyrenula ochraceoflavens]
MSSMMQPPPGGDQSQTRALMGMTIAMLSLLPDAMANSDQLGTAVGAGLDFVEFHYGYGHHRYYINEPSYNRFSYYSYGEWIQTFATLMWTKISICLFLSRLPATLALKRPLHIAVALLFISNLILTLLWILQCLPVKAAWDKTVSGKCFTKAQLLEIILAQGTAACLPTIYPGYRAIRHRLGQFSSRRQSSGEKSSPEKARIWLNADKTRRGTSTTTTIVAPSTAGKPDIPLPEAAVLTSREFGVQQGSPKDSAERLVTNNNNFSEHFAEDTRTQATGTFDWRGLNSARRESRSFGDGNTPKFTTNMV